MLARQYDILQYTAAILQAFVLGRAMLDRNASLSKDHGVAWCRNRARPRRPFCLRIIFGRVPAANWFKRLAVRRTPRQSVFHLGRTITDILRNITQSKLLR